LTRRFDWTDPYLFFCESCVSIQSLHYAFHFHHLLYSSRILVPFLVQMRRIQDDLYPFRLPTAAWKDFLLTARSRAPARPHLFLTKCKYSL